MTFNYTPEHNPDGDWIPTVDMERLVDIYCEFLDDDIAYKIRDGWYDICAIPDNHLAPLSCTEECITVNISEKSTTYVRPQIYLHNKYRSEDMFYNITEYFFTVICGECLEYKPDDDRVFGGMKCGECAYGVGVG